MTRSYHSFHVSDTAILKQQMLSWANQFNICCFLDNHNYNSDHHSFECLLGAGAHVTFELNGDFFTSLADFYASANDWIFGHFNYDLKNRIEQLSSNHPDFIAFPDAFLFVPEVVLKLEKNELIIGVLQEDAEMIFQAIKLQSYVGEVPLSVDIKPRLSREEYLGAINQLLDHIKKGDCYEINFCQEFYAEQAQIDPLQVYKQLTTLSPNPFSGYYRLIDKYLLCASPERYLKKSANKLISQPIKGTGPRNHSNTEEDNINRQSLSESIKDRSENVMVVDLVRNDLSKICEQGSVQVEELFGIYSFPQVYQMISTVTGILKPNTGLAEILASTFPMGSMTGAPKKRVMELIEQYEKSKRGIFSGTIGYITPEKDFDFNVVIRSILYNGASSYLSYQVGGGITSNSIPEKEYEECLLKAAAIKQVLTNLKPQGISKR